MTTVWICRLCGQQGPADTTGRCTSCGVFSGLAQVSRSEADQIARRQRSSRRQRQALWALVAVVLVAGLTIGVLRLVYNVGFKPPAATTSTSPSTAPKTWAQFRRTPENTGFSTDAAPHPHRLRWTFHSRQPIHAAPAVVDHHVYVATDDGRALALERKTGEVVWEYATGWPSSSTPAVAGDRVIIAIRPGVVMGLNRHTGKKLWITDLQHAFFGTIAPLVAQGTIYLGAEDGNLHALDVASGEELWTFQTQNWILSTAAYTAQHVLVLSQDTLIYVIGATTGRQRFTYPTGRGRHLSSSPVIQGDRVYFGSTGGRLGAMEWRHRTYPWDSKLRYWKSRFFLWGILSSPPEQKGWLWSTRLGGDVTHTPALAGSTIYAATGQGKVVAVDTNTGNIQWEVEVGVDISAAPTVAGGSVMIGTVDGRVIAFATDDGQQLWTFQTQDKITASPIVVGDTLYVASHDGSLYALGPPLP